VLEIQRDQLHDYGIIKIAILFLYGIFKISIKITILHQI